MSEINTLIENNFIIFFLICWVIMSYLLAYLSGWSEAGKLYKSIDSGERNFGFSTVYFRWMVRYEGCVKIGATKDYLYLDMLLPFKIGHPPLKIPWKEIQTKKLGREFQYDLLKLPGIYFRVTVNLAKKVNKEAGLKWNTEFDDPTKEQSSGGFTQLTSRNIQLLIIVILIIGAIIYIGRNYFGWG